VRARGIDESMKLAAARAIAAVIPEDQVGPEYIVPSVFNRAVAPAVAAAVSAAAIESGIARKGVSREHTSLFPVLTDEMGPPGVA